jgi:hypothetical protein
LDEKCKKLEETILRVATKTMGYTRKQASNFQFCCAESYRTTSKPTNKRYKKETQLLAYADDTDIVGRSQSAVRDAYLALEREAAKVGLKINEQKTKGSMS